MLKNLIQIKSTSGGEADIQKYIFDYLSALHLNPIYIGGNVVAKIIGKSSKIALIFNAHVDTVPPGDLSKWKHDPYVVTIYKGKIYGLGASDEKSTVEIQLQLAKYFSSQMPGCDIWLTFVEGEETDGHGTKLFLDWFSEKYMDSYNQTSAILGEPTGLKKIEIAHKGNLFLSVTTFGKSGHGSAPHKPSENAVLNMYEVINNLTSLSKSWQYKYINKVLGYPSIALATSIIAGDPKVPNKYPDSCTATFDVRTVPEMNDRALSEIKSIVKMKDVEFKCLYQPIGCGYTDKNSEVVKILASVTNASVSPSESSNDMCFFTEKKIPAVVFGPGEPEVMHKANEYCKIVNINKCLKVYKEVINKYALANKSP